MGLWRKRWPGVPFAFGPYRVDRGRARDLPQIARLERACFPEPLGLTALAGLWVRPGTCYVVARRARRVAAYIGFQLMGPMAHTISMAVDPEFRRQGLGTLVQRTADRVAAARGARWFAGEVRVSNVAQLALLERLGWVRVGVCPGFFGNGEDAVLVCHVLEPPGRPATVPSPTSRPQASAPPQQGFGDGGAVVHPEGPQQQQHAPGR